ncbi:MAG: hypothetical protein IPH96_05930 [Saprospiraceae bacterium]|nr:hypothetical protein [Saprospiraceae bacterium]
MINITPTLCTNETFVFRGTTYSAANPTDRITVVGDGVSICDTIFNINVTIQSAIRRNQMVNLCYKQNCSNRYSNIIRKINSSIP